MTALNHHNMIIDQYKVNIWSMQRTTLLQQTNKGNNEKKATKLEFPENVRKSNLFHAISFGQKLIWVDFS